MFREKGRKALSLFLNNNQNINIFDKYIFEYCDKNFESEKDIENNYLQIIYQIINDIKEEVPLKDILSNIKKDNVLWKHSFYNELILEEVEQNNFIETPFEIEEGVLECECGSKRVFSYQKQSRSADEPMSTYATCVECGNKWVYSG